MKDKFSLGKISERAEGYKPKERETYQMIKDYIEAKQKKIKVIYT